MLPNSLSYNWSTYFWVTLVMLQYLPWQYFIYTAILKTEPVKALNYNGSNNTNKYILRKIFGSARFHWPVLFRINTESMFPLLYGKRRVHKNPYSLIFFTVIAMDCPTGILWSDKVKLMGVSEHRIRKNNTFNKIYTFFILTF